MAHHGGVGGFPGRGISSFPFAPLIWSFINRSMPLNQQGYLTASEVYSLTAFLLERNDIIKKGTVLDAKTLAQVQMPGHANYVPPPFVEWTPGRRQREVGK
jgi:cytochrome c